jgi:hypothetical protein
MKTILIGMACVLLSSTAWSSDYVWHTSKVTGLHITSSGSFVISLQDGNDSCSPITGDDQYTVSVGESGMREVGRKNILATVMVALSQGAKLSIAFDPVSPSCYVNRVQLRYI